MNVEMTTLFALFDFPVSRRMVFNNIDAFTVSITPHCPETTNGCKADSCYNGGICHEGWNRVICDCSNTEYTGATCIKGKNERRLRRPIGRTSELTVPRAEVVFLDVKNVRYRSFGIYL